MKITDQMIWDGVGRPHLGDFDPINGRRDSAFITRRYQISCGMSSLTTELSVETRTIKNSCLPGRPPLKEMAVGSTLEVSLTLYQYSPRTLAVALFGEAMERVAGTVTGEALPELAENELIHLRHMDVSNIVIKDEDDTPYVEDTHYEVADAKFGRIRILEHPGTGQGLTVDYSYGAQVNIPAFTHSGRERAIVFDGVNSDRQHGRLIIPRVTLMPNGAINWVSEEEAEITLSGKALSVDALTTDQDYGSMMRVTYAS